MPVAIHTSRPATAADEPVLLALFSETRGAELAAAGLDSVALGRLIALQYRSHSAQVAADHPFATTRMLEAGGEIVGSIVVDRTGEQVHLVDIVVTETARGRGHGSMALGELISESTVAGRNVTLTVWAGNDRAVALYERLGFTTVGERSGYLAMMLEVCA